MKWRINRRLLVLLFLILFFGCRGYSTGIIHEKDNAYPKTQRPFPKLIVNPNKGKAKESLEISGSGFLPNEKIMVLLIAEGQVKGKSIGTLVIGFAKEESGGITIADENGNFKLTREFPINIKPGVYPIEAKGDKGSRATCLIEFLREKE